MKTNRNHNPTIVHEVQSDFVRLKENFGINSKMFRSDASIERVEDFEISEDAVNGVGISEDASIERFEISEDASIERVEINEGNKFECEYDKWSPNESMK